MPQHRYKYLRQAVTLTGLGSPTFSNACTVAQGIHSRFDREFPEGALQPWSTSKGEMDTLDLSNRYFTPVSEATGQEGDEYQPGVDPKGVLRSMERHGGTQVYIHADDNVVRYYTTCTEDSGNKK